MLGVLDLVFGGVRALEIPGSDNIDMFTLTDQDLLSLRHGRECVMISNEKRRLSSHE